MEVLLKKLYQNFRLEGNRLAEQGLRKPEDYSFKNKNTLFYFNNFIDFNKKTFSFVKNMDAILLENLEKEFNTENNINNTINYYQNLYLENIKLVKELLKYKKHNISLNRELFLKRKIWKSRKKIILKIWKDKIKNTENNVILGFEDISILNKEKFYFFCKNIFYKSDYYLFLKKISLKQIKERYILLKTPMIKEKKKYIRIEIKYHIEELRKNILNFLENNFEIKKANLEFLLDPYSYDLHYFFYEYHIKINSCN